MTDTAGRVATFVIDSNYGSGLRRGIAPLDEHRTASPWPLVREEPVADLAAAGQTALR